MLGDNDSVVLQLRKLVMEIRSAGAPGRTAVQVAEAATTIEVLEGARKRHVQRLSALSKEVLALKQDLAATLRTIELLGKPVPEAEMDDDCAD